MSAPTAEQIRELASWEPALGVVSVYLSIDPGDRAGGWRVELRNGLARLAEATASDEHDRLVAMRATAERIAARFEGEGPPLPRGVVGFVEVAEKPGAERWWETQVAPPASAVHYAERPQLAPLVAIDGLGRRRGVVLASAELVRLLEWAPGRLEELHAWELSIFSRDWRERKAQHPADPARAQGAGSSGRDQFDQRLEHNRRRFLAECRRLAVARGRERGWSELLVFAPGHEAGAFAATADGSAPHARICDEVDLVSVPPGQIEERVAAAVERLEAERSRELVERTLAEAYGGTRASAGRQETIEALAEGRVRCLVFDAGLGAEELVAGALAGGAEIRAVSGEAAERLAEADGVAALLRY
jgi:release factor family 5